jgi:hypothetical protein
MLETVQIGKYIRFLDAGYSASGKTHVWHVATKEDREDLIGEIRWFGSWRCYAFYPYDKTVYEKTCLRDIADFCEKMTVIQQNQIRCRKRGEKKP